MGTYPDYVATPPTNAENVLTIDIDTANPVNECWCCAIDWVSLRLEGCTSPIVLVHGNSLTGAWWDLHGFAAGLDQRKLVNRAITLRDNQATIQGNANNLSLQMRALATAYGVDSIHFVMHSKGGLDVRFYLEGLARGVGQPKVLSYSSLSTPHDGSVLADLNEATHHEIVIGAYATEYQNIPEWGAFSTAIGRRFAPLNGGHPFLTTQSLADFNRHNLARLPRDIVYTTVGADMDLNGNGQIESALHCAPARSELEEIDLDETNPVITSTINQLYQILRNRYMVRVRAEYRIVLTDPIFGRSEKVQVALVIAGSTLGPVGNDVLVTVPSAAGTGGGFASLVDLRRDRTLCAGRNHASIGNAGVVVDVHSGIAQAEILYGDMSP